MKKRVLITGGAGFIGSHLADKLLASGWHVVCLDNESTGFAYNVNPQAEYYKADVRNSAELDKVFRKGVDAVFHIAGQTSTILSFTDPKNDLEVNVHGTLNVLSKCLQYKVSRLLFASSMTTYGFPEKVPIHENEILKPVSYYGITKYAAERYVHATALRNDLDFKFFVTSFRMFNVYGERQGLNNPYQGVAGIFIGNLLRGEPITIHSDGEQTRDFVHIEDVARAWILALNSSEADGRVFNLGTGVPHSINRLADTVLEAFGKSRKDYPVRYAPLRPGDQKNMVADISLVRKTLGWEPKVNFNEGMKRTIQWAIKHDATTVKTEKTT
ncbi:MAG: SDR family NAD(P)-dependent oxidoreductase [Candidatus Omnitrophica bacterium]|nr:SDR family NAD(P)-dependent oxidoreductase [Candidatus Omnitrophota bacterium]